MTLGYALAQIVRRNDIADTLWGIGFVLLSWGAVYLSGNTSWDMIVLASMVTLWGVRLALHIGSRSWGKGEDFRYHAWRQSWMLRGVWYYRIRAYAQVFLLQGVLMYLIASPFLMYAYVRTSAMMWAMVIGVCMWSIGFFFEAIGDFQLRVFLKNKNASIMTTGLWSLTRHPNYFGEIMMWWGIGIYTLTAQLPLSLIALIGPLLITYLLLYVSGIPLLEEKWRDHPEFQAYAQKTPALFPKIF
ncbi:MAG: DUF1295 domain-containing protein [Candidatus Pacebacteria bacterium]|nr:DUF1295 domain-containing protein [Candidatus Paceibacterota bacterium]